MEIFTLLNLKKGKGLRKGHDPTKGKGETRDEVVSRRMLKMNGPCVIL